MGHLPIVEGNERLEMREIDKRAERVSHHAVREQRRFTRLTTTNFKD